jgi:hypothetical protein
MLNWLAEENEIGTATIRFASMDFGLYARKLESAKRFDGGFRELPVRREHINIRGETKEFCGYAPNFAPQADVHVTRLNNSLSECGLIAKGRLIAWRLSPQPPLCNENGRKMPYSFRWAIPIRVADLPRF